MSIQGYATEISVNLAETIAFKVDTDAAAYTIDIYRLGYYRGRGARKIATVAPSAALPQHQPAPMFDESTGMVDCGNWQTSAEWTVPATAVSGVYIAKLTRADTGGASHIPFVVRDDASTADIMFQTSDTTWQAYNRYGGLNVYSGNPDDPWDTPSRARKVSYNRPFTTGGDDGGRDYVFSTEHPTIRFLERNGYDVTYVSGVDTDRRDKQLILNHKVFLSVGHDEYWSQAQRSNIEDARDAGLHLMFLSGNQVFWRIRYEADGSNTPYRTLVCYKETADNARSDPSPETTATWRDPRFPASSPHSGPENRLCGTMSVAITTDLPITVTAAEGRLRLWRGTNLATMKRARAPLAYHTVGYESNEDLDNGCRPPGLIHLSTTVGPVPQVMVDFGTEVAAGVTTHHVTLYRSANNSLVFDAGTIQWAWGLDRHHTGQRGPADSRMQQATVNMLADMEVYPSTLMHRLVATQASTDHQPPVSIITSPRPGDTIANGSLLTVTGAAREEGEGQVAGVEVSIDSGSSWHPATGTTAWSYTAVVHGAGPVRIMSRAIDDSANMELPRSSVEVTVSGPCTLFGCAQPAVEDAGDSSAMELGVRFLALTPGYVSGVRFYKAPANTGPHTASLWSVTGECLVSGTFSSETVSGWQTLEFAQPYEITPDTTYVVSYFAPAGHYAADPRAFYLTDLVATPLLTEAMSPDGDTFSSACAPGGGFPHISSDGANFYVDPIFQRAEPFAERPVDARRSSAGRPEQS